MDDTLSADMEKLIERELRAGFWLKAVPLVLGVLAAVATVVVLSLVS